MTIKNHFLLLILISLFAQCASLKNDTSGTFKDKRDGQTYKWVRLQDGKKWMAQNLNFEMDNSWCYGDDANNCTKYGRLYTWDVARKACPKGWRLPSDEEWWAMAFSYGKAKNWWSDREENNKMDAGQVTYKALIKGENSEFSALLGGTRYFDSDYYYLGEYGYYWSSTEVENSDAWYYCFNSSNQTLYRYDLSKSWGFSCRCIHD